MFKQMKKWGTATLALGIAMIASQNAVAAISNFSITSTDSSVTFRYSYTAKPNPRFKRVYIDSDQNKGTGYLLQGIGADYMIENGNLFRYSGSSQAWGFTTIGTASMSSSKSTVSWVVSRASLSNPSVITAYGNTSNNDFSSVVPHTLSTTTTTTQPPPPVTTTTVPQPPVTTTTVPQPPPTGTSVQVNYSSSTAQIANPERGFYHDMNCVGWAMDVSELRNYRINEGITLIHCYNQINAFLNAPLSSSVLSLFDSNLAVIRSAGLKTVIRFVYTMRDDGADPTLSMINTHMDQLAPYIAKNKDVIATIQIGFIGSWGEWANSVHFGQIQALTSQNMADRKALTDKLLSVVPVDRTVQIRFPRQKVSFYGSAALSATEAFTGTARARIGHHNDCFLTTSSDWGTYTNTSVEYPYLAEETKYVPMGGETCAYMAPRSDCSTALQEMGMFHWSYLNLDYNTSVLDAWRSQGCFDTVKSKLGYRFELKSANLPTSALVGGSIAITLNLQNVGWASPYNARGLELILRNTSTGAVYKVALNSDPRRWLPGSVIPVSQTVTLPSNIPAGTYALLLNLPDGEATLANNPAYSIQLANTNVWEASTGYNRLNANLVISQ